MTWQDSYLAVTIMLGGTRDDAAQSLAAPAELEQTELWGALDSGSKRLRAKAMASVLTRLVADVLLMERA